MSQRIPSRRRERGAALVETAIGTTLMVTVIAFGIHFAEVGYLSLKVQESAISALWNSTHRKMHTTALDYTEADDSVEDAGRDAARRYADFNGLSYINRAAGITQAFTRGQNLTVNCDTGGAGPDWEGTVATRLIYRDQGPAHCTAQADLTAIRIPTSFLENNGNGEKGLYKEQHVDTNFSNLRVCSTGRPVAGQCQGEFSMLVDDWGLAGGNILSSETRTCQMLLGQMPYEMNPPIYVPIPCLNLPFFSAVYGTYLPTAIIIPWMADMMPLAVLGFPAPINSRYFFMSAPGEEMLMNQYPILDQLRGSGMFPTTPGSPMALSTPTYGYSWLRRLGKGRCFLGRDCD
ncbi:TadE/TadG family type IV pilus assembly protein [Pyxidicoccus caerfyrddinensis]|uniref:TadE/TadG family type IV pilus assembly protein n=1 Tax=Pyxidicoccus caerfyrddinensis TaxID=2709663 RepID=UPI0013DD507F|nr:pilus assembly protein [Pyxidicoccus caerfyrddinensis]